MLLVRAFWGQLKAPINQLSKHQWNVCVNPYKFSSLWFYLKINCIFTIGTSAAHRFLVSLTLLQLGDELDDTSHTLTTTWAKFSCYELLAKSKSGGGNSLIHQIAIFVIFGNIQAIRKST